MREPQEIDDREEEQAAARVAPVDVAKAAGVVCTRVPRACLDQIALVRFYV